MNSTSFHPPGRGRKARVIDGFNSSDEEKLVDAIDLEEREFLRVFEEVNNALYSKQTRSELNVDAAPQFFAFTSAASLLIPTLFRMIVIAGMAIAIFWVMLNNKYSSFFLDQFD